MDALPLPPGLEATIAPLPGGAAWLARLPALVREAVARLDLPPPGPPFAGGVAGWTAPLDPARVLKLRFPDRESRAEPDALRLLAGDGAVRLLAEDATTGALVLERARPGTSLLEHPAPGDALAIACAVARRTCRALPVDHPFDGQADVVAGWADDVAAAAHLPVVARRAAAALLAAHAEPETPPVLGNQDLHLGNVLAAQRKPWLLIDPKPVAAEAAIVLGHLVRDVLRRVDDPLAALAATVARSAGLLDLPPARVAGWVAVRSYVDAAWGGPGDGARADLALAGAAARLAAG